MFCPKCGSKIGEGVNFCPSCGEEVLLDNAEAEVSENGTPSAGFKYCARCNKKNRGSEKICRSCGLPFGTVVKGADKKLRVTCEGCGSVYELKKNKAYIITMFVIAAISFLFGELIPLFLLVGIVTGICGLSHLLGGNKKRYKKKCPICLRTPEQVEQDAKGDAKLLRLIEKRKNPLVKKPDYDNPLVSKKTVFNFMPWLSLVAMVLSYATLFIPGDLIRTVEGITKEESPLYGDFLSADFVSGTALVLLIGTLITGLIACITNFNTKARWAGVGFVSGIAASAFAFILFIYNFTLSSFTYTQTSVVWGEKITKTMKVTYSVGLVNFLLFISIVLFAVAAVFGYYIERENRYKRWYVKTHPAVK